MASRRSASWHDTAAPGRCGRGRRRGFAMLLVLIALIIGVVLSLTFLLSQAPSTAIARNVQRHARARLIAESGLTTAIEYIRTSDAWRDEQASGYWLPESDYAEGTFRILFEDEEDGDLADDPAESVTVTCLGVYDGVSHSVKATLYPDASGFNKQGVQVGGTVTMTNSARIDAYRSNDGVYGGTNQGLEATVGTNAVGSDQFQITGTAMVTGSVYVGVGGDPATVIDASFGAVTGDTGTLTQAVDIPTTTLPAGLPASSGNMDIGVSTAITGAVTYDNLTLKTNAKLTVSGDVVIHVTQKLAITNDSFIEIPDGSSLTIYVAGDIDFDTTAGINADTANPDKLWIVQYQPGYKVSFLNASSIAARIETASDVVFSNDTQLYGTLTVAGNLKMTNTSRVHVDLTAGQIGGSNGTALKRIVWLER